jgi:hypothetical protein
MKNKDFAIFILTHGRPDNVITYKTLNNMNYSGKVFFVVDNEDKSLSKYVKNFGKEKIIVFNKKAMADRIDEANNFDNRKVIVHARNVCFEIAKKLNIKYFIQFDDDYTDFRFKLMINDLVVNKSIKNMDNMLDKMIEYLHQDDPKLTHGPLVKNFEEEWSNWLGVKHSLMLNSGSSANDLTMMAIRELKGPGEVIVPPLTWVSDISAVIRSGLEPVFVDIDPIFYTIDETLIEQAITPKTKFFN